ncbi:type III secretion system chaperone [Erwinia psidii]|uniref:Type III secretion system protein n=1 Tax=Erwinia psidii TaxID=69224 RepID=A0A3N6S1T5_9GAMM|nr:type III secretion system chaperone [Erwinia psidii]MCX8957615.1 type III secretion system protein [Erwinia psidii]MCX8960669.1 type III secretion system protein [Erwinia psidii]MCX8964086.1 type III secretion system protein [Erwinia psidii]RQM39568.1 type III secretion system protein [Erwinia psidii]
MRSTELQEWVQRWLDNPGEDQQLVVDEGKIWLQQRSGQLFALAELIVNSPPDEEMLGRALQLSAPALRHFGSDAAALAFQGHSLILVLRLREHHIDAVCEQLESLLNQRDVWQTMLQQQRRKVATHGAVPLHSLALLPRGNHG